MADAVVRLYGIPPDDPVLGRWRSRSRRAARSATSRCRSPSSWPAACARRRARSRRRLSAALGAIRRRLRVEAAPNGYVNFFLDRPRSPCAGSASAGADRTRRRPAKTIVEHTAINPNKAAHIGHLRNAALGDAFGRLLRFLGRAVEIQNYIDDTGVQVADVVVGFRELEAQDARRGPGARRRPRGSTTTAGISTPASPSGTRRTRRG